MQIYKDMSKQMQIYKDMSKRHTKMLFGSNIIESLDPQRIMKKWILRHCDLDLQSKVTNFNSVLASAVSNHLAHLYGILDTFCDVCLPPTLTACVGYDNFDKSTNYR